MAMGVAAANVSARETSRLADSPADAANARCRIRFFPLTQAPHVDCAHTRFKAVLFGHRRSVSAMRSALKRYIRSTGRNHGKALVVVSSASHSAGETR
jgi:hypothetical protein